MAREIWSTDFVTDSRTGTDGPLWWGESAQEGCQRTASRHGLADGNGRSALVGESPRGRVANGPLRVTDSRTGTDDPLCEGESPRGRVANELCRGLADGNGRKARSHLSMLSTSTGEGEARGLLNGWGTDEGQRTLEYPPNLPIFNDQPLKFRYLDDSGHSRFVGVFEIFVPRNQVIRVDG